MRARDGGVDRVHADVEPFLSSLFISYTRAFLFESGSKLTQSTTLPT